MKVSEQAIYLAQLKGMDKKEADRRLRHWFMKFGIASWWDKKVEELSKGMQQKVQFIVTVIHEPKLLIFDEPFSGFDPINVNLLKNEILELRDKGATILFSTHNMASVEELCDNIMLINKGEKILEGSVYDIKQQYKNHSYDIVYKPNDGSGETHLTVNTTNPNELIQDLLRGGARGGVIKFLFLLSPLAAKAQTSSHMLGLGPSKVLDTYLTPEKFSGTGYTFLYIQDNAPTDSLRKRWTTTIEHELNLSTTKDRSGNASDLDVTYNLYGARSYNL